MYFNHKMFWRAEYLALIRSPFRLRRWCYVLVFSGLFVLFLLIVLIGRGLDQLLFGRFRRQAVNNPVFIIAPPRSGTTLLQKLLSLDEQRFVHLKMYQTIFPAVCYQRLCSLLVWLDGRLGSPCHKLLGWCEKKWFGGWDDLHKMRLNQPEEDDALFLYAFPIGGHLSVVSFINELWEAGFPDSLQLSKRRRLMRYYRSCLQRHLYANGPNKTLLSKATQSSGSVEGLLEEFPDATFITIVRDPYRSVASHVSLFVPVWQAHSPDIVRNGPVAKAYARLAVEWYKHLFAFRNQVNPQRYYCIDYRNLARNPRETIERLYHHLGWSITDGYRAKLEAATQRQREFKSKHEYTLEEFGLSREWIRQELAEVIDAYKLDSEIRHQSKSPALK
ncbi:sulfotransferase [Pedosphaera parvula Ellin514]|uniref:Sulfotransferase n=2 Tax=Pedosphaera TaxID=1032526 RepID=B9XG51_PEDPL|nr:sulfotransferase [Pedosphaera parvula Ellin514]